MASFWHRTEINPNFQRIHKEIKFNFLERPSGCFLDSRVQQRKHRADEDRCEQDKRRCHFYNRRRRLSKLSEQFGPFLRGLIHLHRRGCQPWAHAGELHARNRQSHECIRSLRRANPEWIICLINDYVIFFNYILQYFLYVILFYFIYILFILCIFYSLNNKIKSITQTIINVYIILSFGTIRPCSSPSYYRALTVWSSTQIPWFCPVPTSPCRIFSRARWILLSAGECPTLFQQLYVGAIRCLCFCSWSALQSIP